MPDTLGGTAGLVAVPTVATVVALFTIRDEALHALLVPAPGGAWALPGDVPGHDEGLTGAARRVLAAAAGAEDVWLEQLYTFGDPARDPVRREVAVAWYALVAADRAPAVDHDAPTGSAPRWWPVTALPALVLDHRRIVDYAVQRLRNKLEYTTVGFQLLPARFTLGELQRVYEAILDRALDKRNFRRKVELLGIVRPTREMRRTGATRPAQLWRFAATEAPEAIGGPPPNAAQPPAVEPLRVARLSPSLRRGPARAAVTPSETPVVTERTRGSAA
jgi:8-oxo-dGTP diphosphatase